jgi:hypothetical protein
MEAGAAAVAGAEGAAVAMVVQVFSFPGIMRLLLLVAFAPLAVELTPGAYKFGATFNKITLSRTV